MVPPKRWDRGTVTMQLYCTNDGLTTETVRFTAAGVAIANDERAERNIQNRDARLLGAKLTWTSNASSDD